MITSSWCQNEAVVCFTSLWRIITLPWWVEPLWPSDAIWRRIFKSTLARVTACCLTAPSHYLKQCWLLISEVPLPSHENIFMANSQVKLLFCIMSLTNIPLKLLSHLPGAIGLAHWGRDKMAAISQTTLSNALSRMKFLEFRLKIHWNLFPRVPLTIFQHWFR